MRIRLTLDIFRTPTAADDELPDPRDYGTTASQVELDGQEEAGELKAHRMTEPVRMGFQALLKELDD